MGLSEWPPVLAALVVAVTSILALMPPEPPPEQVDIVAEEPGQDVIYIQARAVFTEDGQVYVLDLDKNVHRLNSSVIIYHSKRDLNEKVC